MKRIVSVVAARPNFVKVAAVHRAIEQTFHGVAEHIIVHTGQHYDPLLSDVFFEQLRLPPPAANLGVHGGTRDAVIHATQEAFTEVLPRLRPDIVLVYGDVNGALGAARAAKAAGVILGHVEAGLRSFDPAMPEEHNRIAIDGLADLLFCSEPSGVENLRKENAHGVIHLVGNTMIDTLLSMQPLIREAELPLDPPERYAIVTIHRPSNVDDPASVARNVAFLQELAGHIPLFLPLHHRFRAALERDELLPDLEAVVRVLPPLGYLQFLRLLSGASFILTDSGGIQEEAVLLKKRCFTLRRNTERPVTIVCGSNVLIDPSVPADRAQVLFFARDPAPPQITIPDLWDGKAGERIVEAVMKH